MCRVCSSAVSVPSGSSRSGRGAAVVEHAARCRCSRGADERRGRRPGRSGRSTACTGGRTSRSPIRVPPPRWRRRTGRRGRPGRGDPVGVDHQVGHRGRRQDRVVAAGGQVDVARGPAEPPRQLGVHGGASTSRKSRVAPPTQALRGQVGRSCRCSRSGRWAARAAAARRWWCRGRSWSRRGRRSRRGSGCSAVARPNASPRAGAKSAYTSMEVSPDGSTSRRPRRQRAARRRPRRAARSRRGVGGLHEPVDLLGRAGARRDRPDRGALAGAGERDDRDGDRRA